MWWTTESGFTSYLRPNDTNPDSGWSSTAWCKSDRPNPPCQPYTGTQTYYFGARSRHPGGVQAALCDGSVRMISETIDLVTWRALSTSKGGEVLKEF